MSIHDPYLFAGVRKGRTRRRTTLERSYAKAARNAMLDANIAKKEREMNTDTRRVAAMEKALRDAQTEIEGLRADGHRLFVALNRWLEFQPFARHFDHTGAMNATQLAEHEAYLKLRQQAVEALRDATTLLTDMR